MRVRWMGRYLSEVPSDLGDDERFVAGCPFATLYRDDDVAEALQAHRWFEHGELAVLYPRGVTCGMRRAINAVGNGRARAERERVEEASRSERRQ